MSEFNQMVDVTEKLFQYLDTFEINSGRETARKILLDEIRRDVVEQKMLKLRAKNRQRICNEQAQERYEAGARAYYDKYGTRGEF